MSYERDENDYSLSTNLENYNEAFLTSWKFVCNKFPDLVYFAQLVTIPSISVSGIKLHYKNQNTTLPDNVIDFGQLIISFIVDEDFNNYDRLIGEFFKQERAPTGEGSIRKILHDITVIRLSSNNVPIAQFDFKDCALNNVGSISYTSTGTEPDLAICDVSFSITRMNITNLRKSNLLDGYLEDNCKD